MKSSQDVFITVTIKLSYLYFAETLNPTKVSFKGETWESLN